MNLQTWMANPQLLKLRDKLKDWTRDDLIRYVLAEFGKTELTKAELGQVIAYLRKPNPAKASREIEFVIPEEATKSDFRWKTNSKKLGDELSWILSEGKAELKFAEPEQVSKWAIELFLQDKIRRNWDQLRSEWSAWCRVDRFNPMLYPDAKVDESLAAYLKSFSARTAKNMIPLPDNQTIRKRYWSLEAGQKVYKDGKAFEVVRVRPLTEAPPVIELRETDGN